MTEIIKDYEEVNTIGELDRVLDAYSAYSEDDKRKNWKKVEFAKGVFGGYPETLCSLDPFSEKYKEAIIGFYDVLHKKKYNTDDEGFGIESVESFSKIGFPYITKSASVVGDYLMAYGYIIRTMNLPAGAKILDVGSGPGSLTAHLMKMGYELTCVDVNQHFVELINKIADGLGVEVTALCCDMSDIQVAQKYDAVIFMESFHHTLEHEKVLSIVKRCLCEDGRVFFAAEPVVSNDSDMPYPWGPRLNLESIYSIRQFGWIEMGYQENFFRELLLRNGFQYKRVRSNETWWGDVIECNQIPRLIYGDKYYFGVKGNGVSTLGSGWGDPEEAFSWTVYNEAILSFAIDHDSLPSVKLEFSFMVLLCTSFNDQLIRVFVNDKHVDDWRVVGSKMTGIKKSFFVPPEELPKPLQIKFEIQEPKSPKDLGINADVRKLGFALKSMRII